MCLSSAAPDTTRCGPGSRLRLVTRRWLCRYAPVGEVDYGSTLSITPLRPVANGQAHPGLSAPGRLSGDRSAWSGRLQLRPTGWRARRCRGLQHRMREDLLDHRRLQDRRDDLRLTAAVRAVIHVEVKHAIDPGDHQLTCPKPSRRPGPANGRVLEATNGCFTAAKPIELRLG